MDETIIVMAVGLGLLPIALGWLGVAFSVEPFPVRSSR